MVCMHQAGRLMRNSFGAHASHTMHMTRSPCQTSVAKHAQGWPGTGGMQRTEQARCWCTSHQGYLSLGVDYRECRLCIA